MSTTTDRSQFYADSLQAIEQQLYGPSSTFPIQIELGGQQYSFAIWQGQQLPDRLIAFDTETAAIQDSEIPPLALAQICGDAGSCYFIHPQDLPQFIRQHHQAYWVCHNSTFDFWVTAAALQADQTALGLWWDVAGGSRLYCTMQGDALIRLARIDAEPINRDLATVAAEYCPGLELDKNDPYRLRYAELIGLDVDVWADVERGFWEYAARDPIATLLVAQRQFAIARELIEPYRGELLPDALRRFGPLTCTLQAQGSIALDFISRTGVCVDLHQARQLQGAIAELVEQYQQALEQQLPGCFKRYGKRSKQAGELQRTDAGVPRRDANLIKQHLEQIARQSAEPIKPRRLKNGSCTDAVTYWKQHRDLHPFIDTYVQYSEQAKLAQFFKELQADRIYPRYRPLVRSGRTACSGPNLQQLPRDSRFREMIVAPPGCSLLQIDFSVLELRVLAQICLKRYGSSRLAELFQQGVDCHKYTAACLLGISLEQFEQLPGDQQKQHRQAAKAIGFGTPGGLGPHSLSSYARQAYNVNLSVEQAKDFRQRLITQIYPELRPYLADKQQQTIASNLHTTEALVRQAFSRRDQIQTAQRIISGCEATPEGDEYTAELIEHVWRLLEQLNCNAELMGELIARQPSSTLMRRIFYASAVTISGRLRGHVNFSQAANASFQGLAADGCKLGLFCLLRAGYSVCAFIHDEALIALPETADYDAAVAEVEQILCAAMQELCPDIPISCEYLLASAWYKDAPEQPRDATGCIVPYSRPIEQPAEQPAKPAAKPAVRKPVYDPDTIWAFCPDETPAAVDFQPKPAKPAEHQLPQPLKWHGGKHYLAKRIIGLMPEHTAYAEPFAGGLSVLLQKDFEGISETVN